MDLCACLCEQCDVAYFRRNLLAALKTPGISTAPPNPLAADEDFFLDSEEPITTKEGLGSLDNPAASGTLAAMEQPRDLKSTPMLRGRWKNEAKLAPDDAPLYVAAWAERIVLLIEDIEVLLLLKEREELKKLLNK